MIAKKFCYSVSSYDEAVQILNFFKKEKKIIILFIKYYLVSGLGVDWILELKNMLKKKFISKKFKIFVDIKKDYGIFINLVDNSLLVSHRL